MTSTKKDIVRDVALKTGFDIVTVKDMVQAMFDAMCEGLSRDKNIEIRNFGIFKVKYTPERKARNPKTSEIITVPAKRHINFKPGQEMKMRINDDLGTAGARTVEPAEQPYGGTSGPESPSV